MTFQHNRPLSWVGASDKSAATLISDQEKSKQTLLSNVFINKFTILSMHTWLLGYQYLRDLSESDNFRVFLWLRSISMAQETVNW